MDKVQQTERLISKLKSIADKAAKKKHYNESLSALSACANVLYEYNQRYKDDEIENRLLEIGRELISVPEDFRPKDVHPVQTVLFYDGFGLDLRGLAVNMTRNIASLGYRLIYVTKEKARGQQSHLLRELEDYSVEFVYIDMDSSYVDWAASLNRVFLEYAPQVAYFYTLPYDVSGAMVFSQYKDRVIRFLVNLTDHAFWIGLNAFDYCSTSRSMGSWINLQGRGIPLEKMYRQRSNIFISEKVPAAPLPFDTQTYRYVFSGGALYKTLGDPNRYFYQIIEHIVSTYPDVNFLYAGAGDGSEFEKLIEKYPGRVFLVPEREDFYQIIQGAVFYLNTYPMFGGQMMRFAAYAGRLPVTLRHNDDGEGILSRQDELDIEFDSYEAVIEEIDRLLTDPAYRSRKEETLKIAVVTKEVTLHDYRQLIETQVSPVPVLLEEFDTAKFQKEYIERLDYRKIQEKCIATGMNIPLAKYFPAAFIRRAWHKLTVRQ